MKRRVTNRTRLAIIISADLGPFCGFFRNTPRESFHRGCGFSFTRRKAPSLAVQTPSPDSCARACVCVQCFASCTETTPVFFERKQVPHTTGLCNRGVGPQKSINGSPEWAVKGRLEMQNSPVSLCRAADSRAAEFPATGLLAALVYIS